MKTLAIITISLLLCVVQKAAAGSYFPLYEEQIDGAQGYVWIDPVLRADGELGGFVFSHSTAKKLVVLTTTLQREIVLPAPPEMTVNRWAGDDSLDVYCLMSGSWAGRLAHITVTPNNSYYYDTLPPVPYEWDAYPSTTGRNIRLITHPQTDYAGLLYEAFRTNYVMIETQGYMTNSSGRTLVFDRSLHSTMMNVGLYGVTFGMISGSDTADFAAYNNASDSWDFSDWGEPDNRGGSQGTAGLVQKVVSWEALAQWSANDCNSMKVLVGDFRVDLPHDEVVYVGCKQAAGVSVPGNGFVAACYSFATGSRELVWYSYEDRWDALEYWYADGGAIAGKRGNNVAVFMNARTGEVTDSVVFPHSISSFRFFETGMYPKRLNLVGSKSDTVIVYQFDEVTDVEEPHAEALPSRPILSQNYPNPFNPSTTIEFDIPRRSVVTLTIYNTLGQQVRTLVNEDLSAGRYTRVWDGKTDAGKNAASGLYLYRISGNSFSTSRKMLLLK